MHSVNSPDSRHNGYRVSHKHHREYLNQDIMNQHLRIFEDNTKQLFEMPQKFH